MNALSFLCKVYVKLQAGPQINMNFTKKVVDFYWVLCYNKDVEREEPRVTAATPSGLELSESNDNSTPF